METKSPFYVVRNFLTNKQCEYVVDELEYFEPDIDKDGNNIRTTRQNEKLENLITERFDLIYDKLENYYDFVRRGTEAVTFEIYPEGVGDKVHCESSFFSKQKKWVKHKDRDISIVVFLSDYNDNPDFDSYYEEYGAKLEFPQHKFSFNPERGTLVAFPSTPHFINAISCVQVGTLYLARFHIGSQAHYLYDPGKFNGDYTTWFKDELG